MASIFSRCHNHQICRPSFFEPRTSDFRLPSSTLGLCVAVQLFLLLQLTVASIHAVEIHATRLVEPVIVEEHIDIAKFSSGLRPLWLEALNGDEDGLQMQAAHAIARAHAGGMLDWSDAAPRLLELLDDADTHEFVQLACASALVALDAQDTAPRLFAHAQSVGYDMALLVEPALARWKYEPAREAWRSRIAEGERSAVLMNLAIDGIVHTSDHSQARPLADLSLDASAPVGVRLAAARAASQLEADGLLDSARQLLAKSDQPTFIQRLLAATLLSRLSGEEVQQLLLTLAADPEPSVQTVALVRLRDLDPFLILPLLDKTITSPDANVRMLIVECLDMHETVVAVEKAAPLLDDPHPDVRAFVRDSLVRLAGIPELDETVRAATMKVFLTDRPKGLLQATIVLGALDHEDAVDRMMELLDFSDLEVRVAAAWALKMLAVPSTAEPLLERVKREIDAYDEPIPVSREPPVNLQEVYAMYKQVEHILEGFGLMAYQPAKSTLMFFAPKPPLMGAPSPEFYYLNLEWRKDLRSASLWSLAQLYMAEPDEQSIAMLVERMADVNPAHPEIVDVRVMCAVSLGLIDAQDEIQQLKSVYESESPGTKVRLAARWTLQKLTGEALPDDGPIFHEYFETDWFLEPIGG